MIIITTVEGITTTMMNTIMTMMNIMEMKGNIMGEATRVVVAAMAAATAVIRLLSKLSDYDDLTQRRTSREDAKSFINFQFSPRRCVVAPFR
jgi:hypothetical protein